jgi:hypothetical protein
MINDTETQSAHAAIGGFIVKCSLLDYRASQFISRWFCSGEQQKYLSYTLQGMNFAAKRQVIEERLTRWHAAPDELRAAMVEIARVFERRELVRNGVLSRRSNGQLCIKSFSGTRYLTSPDEVDIIAVDELTMWSERAMELADQLIRLAHGLHTGVA